MFIRSFQIESQHQRSSKLGKVHTYIRFKTVAIFQCDNCDLQFQRDLGKMDHRRLSNGYFHVCSICNPKKFAQAKSAERRKIWNLSANSDISIAKV